MSRNNIRIKFPRTPVKVTKRRGSDSSSSLNLSDDEGYSGLEDLSESDEDDEEHVFAAEENHIINHASRKRPLVPPRPVVVEDPDDADEEGDDDDEEEDDDEAEDDDPADENASWDGIMSEPEEVAAEEQHSGGYIFDQDVGEVQKHVRFASDVPDSDSDSTTSEASDDVHDMFPDIFVDKSNLDPSFRREIENDDYSSSTGSFWDFHNGSHELYELDSDDDCVVQASEDTTPTVTPMPSQAPTEVSTPVAEVQELDGYETDGDTTEEDVPEPPIRRKQIRRIPSVEPSSDTDVEKGYSYRRGKPRVGRFNLDADKKPIAVLNPMTRKMMIFTPQRNSRLDLSPESFNMAIPAPDLSGCSPILSNPGYLMMGAMLSHNTFGDFINTQPFGPAEAFFPMTSDAMTGEDSDYSSQMAPEDEEESKLELEDFITFDEDSSDDEKGEADDYFGDVGSSPTRPNTAASGVSAVTEPSAETLHPLLSHFDNNSNAVGAFRRNQINQQLIYSDKASQESLAFSGPYYHGTLRGIKSGSMGTVTAPITPARRQKRSNTVAGLNDPSDSPLSSKRKASNLLDAAHKRHRSISDMEVLQI